MPYVMYFYHETNMKYVWYRLREINDFDFDLIWFWRWAAGQPGWIWPTCLPAVSSRWAEVCWDCKHKFRSCTVLGIRIRRIRMFMGHPDSLVEVRIRLRIRIFSFSLKGVQRTKIMLAYSNFNTKCLQKIIFLRLKIMCLRVIYKKKNMKTK